MNYPSSAKKEYHKIINYANRGMDLENLLNITNQYYLDNDMAVIYKKATPIGIAKVSYENKKRTILKSYFKEQSTLDYNGLYKGYYIDFDAKVTKSKTSFPLSNIHEHQLKHMERIIKHGGITFLIIYMNGSFYLLPGIKIMAFIKNNVQKSLPYQYICDNSYIIKESYNPPLDYLKMVDLLIKENNYEKD